MYNINQQNLKGDAMFFTFVVMTTVSYESNANRKIKLLVILKVK